MSNSANTFKMSGNVANKIKAGMKPHLVSSWNCYRKCCIFEIFSNTNKVQHVICLSALSFCKKYAGKNMHMTNAHPVESLISHNRSTFVVSMNDISMHDYFYMYILRYIFLFCFVTVYFFVYVIFSIVDMAYPPYSIDHCCVCLFSLFIFFLMM